MGENAGIESGSSFESSAAQGVEQPTGDNSTGLNPAWNELLSQLPDQFHGIVRPTLEKWDQNHQNGIQKVHSQYEPWKPIIEGGFEPQTIQYALAILDKMENDPRSIYDALGQYHGWMSEQGQPESANYDGDEELEELQSPLDPRIERAEKLSEAVASYIMEQHQKQQEAEEDAALDAEISQLKQKYGVAEDDNAAERFIMGLMLAGASAEQAFQEYNNLTSSLATRPRANDSAPTILGAGGGTPSSQIPVSQFRNGNSRKALVAQMLANQE